MQYRQVGPSRSTAVLPDLTASKLKQPSVSNDAISSMSANQFALSSSAASAMSWSLSAKEFDKGSKESKQRTPEPAFLIQPSPPPYPKAAPNGVQVYSFSSASSTNSTSTATKFFSVSGVQNPPSAPPPSTAFTLSVAGASASRPQLSASLSPSQPPVHTVLRSAAPVVPTTNSRDAIAAKLNSIAAQQASALAAFQQTQPQQPSRQNSLSKMHESKTRSVDAYGRGLPGAVDSEPDNDDDDDNEEVERDMKRASAPITAAPPAKAKIVEPRAQSSLSTAASAPSIHQPKLAPEPTSLSAAAASNSVAAHASRVVSAAIVKAASAAPLSLPTSDVLAVLSPSSSSSSSFSSSSSAAASSSLTTRSSTTEEKAAVFLWPSRLSNTATVLFDYPVWLNIRRNCIRIPLAELNSRLHLRFKLGEDAILYNCVVNAFRRSGLRSTNAQTQFNVRWGKHLPTDEYKLLKPFQMMNHFPGTWCLGRKDRMVKCLTKLKRAHPEAVDFLPESYLLPGDRSILEARMAAEPPGTVWIVKPPASSCGRGIRLITKLNEIKSGKRDRGCLVCRYIVNPLLLNGYKFDLRIYVLVTNYSPLTIYLYDNGLVRLCTMKYSLAANTIKKRFMHLTNYAVNKKNKQFVHNVDADKEDSGSKWSLKALWAHLLSAGLTQVQLDQLWARIESVLIRTIIAIEGEVISLSGRLGVQRGQCFELLGFDVMLDDTLKPWLMEVNVAPSLASSSPMDKAVKMKLLADVMHIVGVKPCNPKMKIKPGSSRKGGTPFSISRPTSSSLSRSNSGLSARPTDSDEQSEDSEPDEPLGPQSLSPSRSAQQQSSSSSSVRSTSSANALPPKHPNSAQAKLSSSSSSSSSASTSNGSSATPGDTGNSIQSALLRIRTMTKLKRSLLAKQDIELLRNTEDEFSRRGPFKRIFPTPNTHKQYSHLFESDRYPNLLIAKYLELSVKAREKLLTPKKPPLLYRLAADWVAKHKLEEDKFMKEREIRYVDYGEREREDSGGFVVLEKGAKRTPTSSSLTTKRTIAQSLSLSADDEDAAEMASVDIEGESDHEAAVFNFSRDILLRPTQLYIGWPPLSPQDAVALSPSHGSSTNSNSAHSSPASKSKVRSSTKQSVSRPPKPPSSSSTTATSSPKAARVSHKHHSAALSHSTTPSSLSHSITPGPHVPHTADPSLSSSSRPKLPKQVSFDLGHGSSPLPLSPLSPLSSPSPVNALPLSVSAQGYVNVVVPAPPVLRTLEESEYGGEASDSDSGLEGRSRN